jgi:hypothetical protein
MKVLITTICLITSSMVLGQTLSYTFSEGVDLEAAVKNGVVGLIKGDLSLSKKYQDQMDKAFDFLDPEDPRRISASDLENLGDWSLSLWKPSSSFRMGQGNITCDSDEEIASFEYGTMLVGFDTSYKRESVYGFWSSVTFSYNFCEDSQGKITKSTLDVTHNKWIQQELVEDILGY